MTFWLILALILTFLHLPNRDPLNSTYFLGLIIIGTCIIGTKVFKANKPLGIGIISVLASYIITLGSPLTLQSFNVLVFFLLWIVIYWAARTAKKRPLFWAFGIAGALITIHLIMQRFGYDPVFTHLSMKLRYPIFGFLGSIGNTAAFQALCLPIAASINPFLGVASFIGLILTGNAVGTTGGLFGIGYYLFTKKRFKTLIIAILLICISIMIFDKPTKADFKQRWHNITYSLKYIKKGEIKCIRKPFIYKKKYSPFGYGLGSFNSSMPFIPTEEVNRAFNRGKFDYLGHPHNEPTFILYELGPVGLIVSIWIMINALKTKDRAIRSSFIAFIICALGYFPLTVIPIMIEMAILLGLKDRRSYA